MQKLAKVIFGLIILTVFLMGCAKHNPVVQDDDFTMDDLQIPDGFSFKSSKDIEIKINMPASLDFNELRSRFDIYTKNPAEGGQLISSGSFDKDGSFDGKIRIPSTLNEVYVSTIAGSATVSISSANGLKSGGIIINFGDDYGYLPPDTVEPSFLKSYPFDMQLKATDEGINIIGNGDFSSNNFGSAYYWYDNIPLDNKWYFTTYRGKMEWVSESGNGMIKTNSASYYNNQVGGCLQLIETEPGDVVTFSADIKSDGPSSRLYSWLYLIPLNSNGQPLAYYNVTYFRPSGEWTRKTIAASMPNGTVKCKVLIWQNDYTSNSSIYFDNVVVTGPVTDVDGDGVSDEDDEYPNDADRAFNIYYPNANTKGSFAFEDNWPGKGDYDFNDLVVDYQFKQVVNSSNELVDLEASFKFKASGATFLNGFGFEMGLAPNDIASVTGTSLISGYINTLVNGSEAGQTKGTIIVTDNVFTQIPNPGGGIGSNTTTGGTYVEPVTLNIKVTTVNPVSLDITGTPPYNPFIIVDTERGREVHLADYPPTSLANNGYFGSEHDRSDPGSGKYYKTQNNLPWGIDTPVPFDYPVEKAQIINAHLKFASWAESGGNVFTDWYQNLSGYRNSENIFQIPN